ncbi:MAG: HD domain-containing protein [bacterium]|nr:HD domain-containing protein [bacterium]
MNIPQEISDFFAMLPNSVTFIYGKAVRDIIMSRTPKICSAVTSAPLSFLRRVFPGGSNASGKFRASVNGCEYVLISARADMTDVCAAQDFTINSAAYSDITGLHDSFGAVHDIKNGIVSFMRPDETSVSSNPILMLKAVRLCAELDFKLDEKSESIIKQCASKIRLEHPHRMSAELEKLLMSPHPDDFRELHRLGLLKYIMPQLERCFGEPQKNKYHIYDVGEHIMHAVKNTPKDYVLRWSALLHDVGKPCCSSTDSNGIIHFYGHHHESRIIADDILHRFGIERSTAKDILTLIENHDVRVDPSPASVKKIMCRTGGDLFEKLMLLQTADNMAKNPKYFTEKYKRINAALKISRNVIKNKEPYNYSQLMVNSRDLQKCGIRPGRETNDVMRALMDEIIHNPQLNARNYLLQRARELRKY